MRGHLRGDATQMTNRIGDSLYQRVHLLLGILRTERKTDGGPRLLAREADRDQYVRRLDSTAGTSGSARDGEAPQIERDQQRLAFDSVKADIRGVRDPLGAPAIHG